MLKSGIFLLAVFALTGTALAADPGPRLTDKQAKALAKALDGKEPGKPVSCVGMRLGSSNGPTPVSDGILLLRVNKDLTYRNDLNGLCTGISRGSTLVLQPTNSQYCRNDIAHVVDLGIGMRGGSCALGDWVPYRTPGK